MSGISLMTIDPFHGLLGSKSVGTPEYSLKRDIATRFYDGNQCWIHARVGIIPQAGKDHLPRTILTMNTHDVNSSDIFKQMMGMYSNDLGANWSVPGPLDNMAPQWEIIMGENSPVVASDFWPKYHVKTKQLLGIGHTVVYTPDWKLRKIRPRHTVYSVFDSLKNTWPQWNKLIMPDPEKFHNAGAGSVQRFDLDIGEILLPIYFSPPGSNSKVTVLRCGFDGSNLSYKEHGNEISIDDDSRGLHEPSLASYEDRFFLTIRNDNTSFVTSSKDGLNFEPYKQWTFDDGADLGTHNTQQHWVIHSEGLFLVYTRRGADNDHVIRNRAPLFIGQVDPEKLCVIRSSEQILVPNHGAALGNFGVSDVSPFESWVTVGENMYKKEVQDYGSDGSVWIARIHWRKPNELFKTT